MQASRSRALNASKLTATGKGVMIADRKGWLFRTSRGHNATALSEQPMNQSDAWCMIRRRAVTRRSAIIQ
jgi:hypothetical protein